MADDQPEKPFEAWQLRTNGFTKFRKKEKLITTRPSVGQARGNEKATKRKKVTGLDEIKQLALAEGNGTADGASNVKEYNQFLKDNNKLYLENSCCWLCGKPFYEEPLVNPNRLGYLEVEHALPLKLGTCFLPYQARLLMMKKARRRRQKKITLIMKKVKLKWKS